MVQLVAQDCIFSSQNALKQAGIGIKAGRIQDRVRCPMKITDLPLKLLVQILDNIKFG